jgi:hypothetical protein
MTCPGQHQRNPLYAPECVEGKFSEVGLPLYGVLRSSAQPRSNPYERPRLSSAAFGHYLTFLDFLTIPLE